MFGKIGIVILLFLAVYILWKRRDLISFRLTFSKKIWSGIFVILLIVPVVILLCDRGIAFLFSNRYPHGLLSLFPTINMDLTTIFKMITHLGEPNYLVLFILPFFLYSKWKKIRRMEDIALGTLASMIIGGIIANILKIFFMRSRPFEGWNSYGFYFIEDVIEGEIPFNNKFMSFPSGHTLAAFSAYIFLYLENREKILKVLWIAIPILVGISRIYLSQHWLSDVLTSAVLGTIVAKNMQLTVTNIEQPKE